MTGEHDRRKIGDINVTLGNHNKIGNIGHVINVDRRPKRSMPGEMKEGLLRDLPKDRPVQVLGMNGNTESMAYANEIHAFLKANGYEMAQSDASSSMIFNPPVGSVNISRGNGGKEWWIKVGPAE